MRRRSSEGKHEGGQEIRGKNFLPPAGKQSYMRNLRKESGAMEHRASLSVRALEELVVFEYELLSQQQSPSRQIMT